MPRHLYDSPLYAEDIEKTAAAPLPWEKLSGRTVTVSGVTGLIGSFLADVLMRKNRDGLGVRITGLGRSAEKAAARFRGRGERDGLYFFPCDINDPSEVTFAGKDGYVLHLASNTHPVQYASDPVGTIMTNVTGLRNMLDLALKSGARRFVFASSNEIYGENRGDAELFDEKYCGYIDPNTLRAGYPESKRCGEALCQAYRSQFGLDAVIPRLTRTYGPTVLDTDTKAVSQFIKKAVSGEDIVLKSAGSQFYSFTYVADAVSGLLTVMLLGEDGGAYNVADTGSNITLRELAGTAAAHAGTRVVYEIPDALEAAGYSRATKARLDGSKLRALGWRPLYTVREGIPRTIDILRSIR